MPIAITIPRLGWSMDEGTFAEWLKSPGEFVEKGDMVFLLEGEKAVQEIESFDSGTLHIPPDAPQPGDVVQVGQCIGFLLAAGETPPESVSLPDTSSSSATPPADVERADTALDLEARPSSRSMAPAPSSRVGGTGAGRRAAGPAARRMARQLGINLDQVPTPDPTGRILVEDVQAAVQSTGRLSQSMRIGRAAKASPRARRRARELGIDWRELNGSGRNGRVRERDVVARSRQIPVARTVPALRPESQAPAAPGRHEPAQGIRRTIAQRMLAAIQQTAPVTLTTRVNASQLVAARAHYQATGDHGIVPGYTDMFVRLVAHALGSCPALNACWHNDGLYFYDDVNIAIAIDTAVGLLAPVLRHADRLDLRQIAERSRVLTERARTGQLSQSDLAGGTFTVTSLGMYGIDAFTPIINQPQSAILGIGRILHEPIVSDGEVVAGHTVTLSLTIDHRVIDGGPAARWLQQLGQVIEHPFEALGINPDG